MVLTGLVITGSVRRDQSPASTHIEADRISAPGDLGRSMIWKWPPTGRAEPARAMLG